MKTSKNALTLENIEKLFGKKLDPIMTALGGSKGKIPNIYGEIKGLNTKVVGIYGELDGLKQQIAKVDGNLSTKIDTLRKETKDGFDGVYDALDGITHTLDHDFDPKIKRLENKVFAQ